MFKDEYLLDFINTENLGQLCTYLQALDLTVKKPHENSSIDLLAELKKRLKISIFLWRKSCASR